MLSSFLNEGKITHGMGSTSTFHVYYQYDIMCIVPQTRERLCLWQPSPVIYPWVCCLYVLMRKKFAITANILTSLHIQPS